MIHYARLDGLQVPLPVPDQIDLPVAILQVMQKEYAASDRTFICFAAEDSWRERKLTTTELHQLEQTIGYLLEGRSTLGDWVASQDSLVYREVAERKLEREMRKAWLAELVKVAK